MDTVANLDALKHRLRKLGDRLALGFAIFVVITPALFVMFWMLSLAFKKR